MSAAVMSSAVMNCMLPKGWREAAKDEGRAQDFPSFI